MSTGMCVYGFSARIIHESIFLVCYMELAGDWIMEIPYCLN